MSEPQIHPSLADLLVRRRPQLVAWVQREAGIPLLRFETAEDLTQGIHQEALRAADRFEWQGEDAFVGWLHQIGRRYILGRRDHWFALKRNGGALLRLTWGLEQGGAASPRGRDRHLVDTQTGPVTFAFRREQMMLAMRAVSLLLPRDRDIVNWCTQNNDLDRLGLMLGVSPDAAERARSRAFERLRKTFALVCRQA